MEAKSQSCMHRMAYWDLNTTNFCWVNCNNEDCECSVIKLGRPCLRRWKLDHVQKSYSPDQDGNTVVERCKDKTEAEYNLCIVIEIKEAFPANAVMPALQG